MDGATTVTGVLNLGLCAFIPRRLEHQQRPQPSPGSLLGPNLAQAKTFHRETLKRSVCQQDRPEYHRQIPRHPAPHVQIAFYPTPSQLMLLR